jgi:hypothetical protein
MLRWLLLVLLVTPAFAAAADAPPKKERLICRREVKPGSLIAPRRICLTKEEWKLTQFYNRETVRGWQEAVNSRRLMN